MSSKIFDLMFAANIMQRDFSKQNLMQAVAFKTKLLYIWSLLPSCALKWEG